MKNRIPGVNFEWNLLIGCPRRCCGCDRSVEHYPERREEMSLEQVDKAIQQLRDNKYRIRAKKIKLAGGEPTMHSQFVEIYWKLIAALEEGVFEFLKINMSDHEKYPRPASIPDHPKVRWLHSHPRKKSHLPYMWSPTDLGIEMGPCRIPQTCGISLDATGKYLPCSASIMVVRAFGLEEEMYKEEVPDGPWGLEKICDKCIHSANAAWKKKWFEDNPGLTKTQPTESWVKALASYEERYNIQKKVFSNRTPLALV